MSCMRDTLSLKYELARDLTYDMQHCSNKWQQQVTVIGSIDLDSRIDECLTAVGQFWHAELSPSTTGWKSFLCEGVLPRRLHSLLRQMRTNYSHSVNFGVANTNSFYHCSCRSRAMEQFTATSQRCLLTVYSRFRRSKDIFVWTVGTRHSVNYFNCAV